MFKKLLSIAAVAAMCFSAKAEMVQDYLIDYTTTTWNFYVMGYIPSQENGWLTITQTRGSWERVDGEAVYTPNSDNDGDGEPDISWYQLFVADGIPTKIGKDYKVTIYGKADVDADCNMNMQWGWLEGESISRNVPFTTEWSEIDITYPEIGGGSCALILQPGVQETTFEIKWIKVCHNEKVSVVKWGDNILTGGDAEDGKTDCAVAKIWQGSNDSPIEPCAIEAVEGGHAFVVHATQKYENPWDNQFWIVAPKTYKKGEIIMVSFRYKADKAAKVSSQGHENPGEYLNGDGVGDLQFGPEWQTVTKQLSIGADGWHSMAFNLSEIEEENTYYFDDLSIREMLLDEGWFVAYDLDNLDEALEFSYVDFGGDVEENFYEAYVPERVETIMISTKRGNDDAFTSHSIKVSEEIEDGEWIGFTYGYSKIALPEESDWTIKLDPLADQICFEKGDTREGDGIMSAINDNNVAPVYYNLQGVQVSNPSNGIFIVKKGNKVTKQVIR